MSLYTTNDRNIVSSPVKTFIVSNATLLAAGNPNSSLAAGQFGAFAYDATDRRFETKTTAITDANINAGLKMYFAVGYNVSGGGVSIEKTAEFNVADIKYQKKVYTAPTKAKRAIGYNGTTGSLNFTTVVTADEYLVKLIRTTELTTPYEAYSFSYVARLNDTPYTVMSTLAKDISNDASFQYAGNYSKRRYRAELITSVAGSVFGNSATVAAVKDATSLTTSAAHLVAVGDYVSLRGDVYRAITGTTGSTLVLDRPYSGATEAVLPNNQTLDLGATAPTATQMGLGITTEDNFETFAIAVDGDLEGSTLSELATMTSGSGIALQVSEEEQKGFIVDGFLARNFMSSYKYPQPDATASSAAFYTLYNFTVRNQIAKQFSAAKQSFQVYVQQTDASTPSAFNAAFDTLLGAIPTGLMV